MKTEKIVKNYRYEGLGVPIVIKNALFKKAFGDWFLDIDLNKLQKELLNALIHKNVSLNGNEIRFIRKYFEMTTTEFGDLLGVTHPAVLKWEKGKSQIPVATEKYVRLYAYDRMKAKDDEFRKFFSELSIESHFKTQKGKSDKPLQFNAA
jgi:DNA-binding transcriptional regulator YiaG